MVFRKIYFLVSKREGKLFNRLYTPYTVIILLLFSVFFIREYLINIDSDNDYWGVRLINAEIFWSDGITGKGINIAILDSGIYADHSDFGSKIKEGVNFVNKDQLPIDDGGHGTLIAGIISAKHNNMGIDGVAPDANIYPLKVLDKWGNGEIGHVIEAIYWCIDNNIDIINMSFAISENSTELDRAIRRALDANVIIVAAAMNSYGNDVGYPAANDGVVSVTAIDAKSNLSQTGPYGKVDFSAPGVDVLSTSINNDYSYVSGTSIATPYITGIIALLLQREPSARLDIYKELLAYVVDLGVGGKDPYYGEGTIYLINHKGEE